MDRSNLMRQLASICRQSPEAALWCLGYLCQTLESDVLEDCVEGAQEVARAWRGPTGDHLRAYEERWGRRPV